MVAKDYLPKVDPRTNQTGNQVGQSPPAVAIPLAPLKKLGMSGRASIYHKREHGTIIEFDGSQPHSPQIIL